MEGRRRQRPRTVPLPPPPRIPPPPSSKSSRAVFLSRFRDDIMYGQVVASPSGRVAGHHEQQITTSGLCADFSNADSRAIINH